MGDWLLDRTGTNTVVNSYSSTQNNGLFQLPMLKGLQVLVPLCYVAYLLPTSNLEEQIYLSMTILFSAIVFLQAFLLYCTHTRQIFQILIPFFK